MLESERKRLYGPSLTEERDGAIEERDQLLAAIDGVLAVRTMPFDLRYELGRLKDLADSIREGKGDA